MWVYYLLLLVAYVQGKNIDHGDKRIVNGRNAPEGAFPWQVSLRNTNGKEYHFCGGSIIDKKWILTAAHCAKNREADSFVVVVGTNKLSAGGKRYKVDSIIRHKDFDPDTLNNDIGLLKLAEEIEYNDKVKAVQIDESYVEGYERCVVSGWGYTDNYNTVPDNLQMLDVVTITVKDCKTILEDVTGPKYNEKEICARAYRGSYSQGVCQGDSGGPIVRNNKLVGLVAWGVPCAEGYPDVFTRVSSYLDWIKNNKN